MKVFVRDRVLHVVFKSKTCPPSLDALGTLYEGVIPGRLGVNLPMSVLRAAQPHHRLAAYDADYIVCYPDWEPGIRQHELFHAVYHRDPAYRAMVRRLWNKAPRSYRDRVRRQMAAWKYPEFTWLDEWQAYLFTGTMHLEGEFASTRGP